MLVLASLTVAALVAATLLIGSPAPQLRPVPVRRRHRYR